MKCLLLVPVALAAGCAHTGGMRLAEDLAPLSYFVGRWHADARDPGTGKTFTLRYAIQPSLRGEWLEGSGESPEMGMEIRDMWGRDPVTREIVRTVFDSRGTWGVVRSPGWEGDTLVFEGEARVRGAGLVRVRETIRRETPDRFRAVWEALQGEAWVPYSEETLTRQ